ncbi:MAG TPA: tetratricopeptide repeat protein, partial [Vicinamibacterales bacterium]|nr:tetratricopeptide repeat protein [Vicinamibacterales bacterium]
DDYPTTTEAWALLSEAYTAAGDPDEAIRALDEGSAFDPRLLFGLAELYERQEQWLEAAETYERAAAFGPASRELKGRWAGALLNAPGEESAQRARELLEQIVADVPDDDRAFYMLSQAHRRLRAWDAAEAAARRVIALRPESLWGPYALAQVFEDRRDYARVVETLAPALEKWTPSPRSPKAHGLTLLSHLGFAYLQLGRHDDAIAAFERARGLADDPSGFTVYLGQAYVVARRYDEALAALEPLRAAQPNDYRVTQLTARALAGAGRVDEAVALLRGAIAHEPAPDRYLLLSQVLADGKRTDEAHALLDEAAAKFPNDVTIPFQRGALYENAGDTERAEAAFREVLQRDPRHAPALNYLGYMFAERGVRLEEALSLIERALAIDPDNGAYLDSLGWAYYQLKQYDRAHFHLARAAERLPTNSVVQDHLGDVLAALGRREEAIAAWTRALNGDRESIEVAAIERKIRRARSQAER